MLQLVGRKLPIRTWAVNGLLIVAQLALLGGCGPIVQRAPFPERPDSVKAGFLFGPFEGRVVDADTEQPLADALIWCSWSFERGLGNAAPEAVRSAHATTNADGAYRIAPLRRFPQGLTTRLSHFSLVVYKKGYVAYRDDRLFNQRRQRSTFSQLNNQIRLSRWSPELSHADHLLFIGGAPPLLKASAWEIPQAVAELEGRRPRAALEARAAQGVPARPTAGLNASILLSSDDVRTITSYTGAFREDRLAGKRTATYDTFHLRAVDRPERYDVAVRLWRLSDDQLTAKYEEVLGKLPGSKQSDEVADRSFVVQQGEILGLGFMDRTSSALVLLTCGRGQCADSGHLLKLARKIESNLRRLPPVKGDAEPSLLPDAPPGPQEDEE